MATENETKKTHSLWLAESKRRPVYLLLSKQIHSNGKGSTFFGDNKDLQRIMKRASDDIQKYMHLIDEHKSN